MQILRLTLSYVTCLCVRKELYLTVLFLYQIEFVLCGGWGPVTLGVGCGIDIVFIRLTRGRVGGVWAEIGDAYLPLTLSSI